MFGLTKKNPNADKLAVQIQVVSSAEAYALATRIWNENVRTLLLDQQTGKQFLRFGYTNPTNYVVWLQRDQGRADPFELVLRWEADKRHEVYIVSQPTPSPVGNDARVKALLNNMLITPSVMLSGRR